MNQIQIGKYIAECRKKQGLLQKDIAARLGISEKTVSKWECGYGLPEVAYMEPLCRILGITVSELLAGKPITIMELLSQLDMSRLELLKQIEFEQLRMRIYKLYDIEIQTMESSPGGAGSLTYFVTAQNAKFVVKYPSDTSINHIDVEVLVCEHLIQNGIPACRFLPNKQGKMISTDENGRRFTIQQYYEGVVYNYHEAPVELQTKSAAFLAKLQNAMRDLDNIPIGIGADFLKYRRPEYMKKAYSGTLKQALENQDYEVVDHIHSNIRIAETMSDYQFDITKFSSGNTHGDYMISQLIWKDGEIHGVIDFTSACRHPYIWEIVRSYVFMAPEVKQGEIRIEGLLDYILSYSKYAPLKSYDIENAGRFFFYFLAVCDFYGQYYGSLAPNRHIYYEQANMAAHLLVWFDNHIDELNEKLYELSENVSENAAF